MSGRLWAEPRFTYGDYLLWDGEERWELYEGEAILMSPGPSRLHQSLVGEIYRQIATFLLDSNCQVYIAPFDIRLPKGDEADELVETVLQPDISVVCDTSKLDKAGCRGACR